MNRKIMTAIAGVVIPSICLGQNVGISNPAPTEKLHVDSGSIKIGKLVWDGTSIPFLKFGDANYVTLGEEEADDKLTIRAKELFIRPSTSYATVPVSIQGSQNYSHFFYGDNEDTYIRAGKNNSSVILNDISGGKVGIGIYPQRSWLEQSGAVGNTAALFGSDGAGISLQMNNPAIGFNHYHDGANNKSIGPGYVSQIAVDETNGTLFIKTWSSFAPVPNSLLSSSNSSTKKFNINRFGKIGIGFGSSATLADPALPDLAICQTTITPSSSLYDRSNGLSLCYSNNSINNNSSINLSIGDLTDGPVWQNALKIFGFPTGGPIAVIHPNTGQYIQLSDKKVKKDIELLESNTLKKIMQLRPSVYHMSNDDAGAKFKYGFISQEVEKIFPDMVFETGQFKMLAYESLIPILTKGIQEQQQQIEYLKREIEELKKLIISKK